MQIGNAERSERKPMYHKIPACALRRLAERYTEGSRYDGPDGSMKIPAVQNWQQGNAEFFADAFNHLVEHLFRWASGDRTDDHLAAAAWGCFALMWAQEQGIIS